MCLACLRKRDRCQEGNQRSPYPEPKAILKVLEWVRGMKKTWTEEFAKDRANQRASAERHKIHCARCAAFYFIRVHFLDDGVWDHCRARTKSEEETTDGDWQDRRKEDHL